MKFETKFDIGDEVIATFSTSYKRCKVCKGKGEVEYKGINLKCNCEYGKNYLEKPRKFKKIAKILAVNYRKFLVEKDEIIISIGYVVGSKNNKYVDNFKEEELKFKEKPDDTD